MSHNTVTRQAIFQLVERKLLGLFSHPLNTVGNPRESGCNSIWWYPQRRFSLEKTVAPVSACTVSSNVGIGWRSRMTASFARRVSTQTRTSPFDFGTATYAETQGGRSLTRFYDVKLIEFTKLSVNDFTYVEGHSSGWLSNWRDIEFTCTFNW